MPGLLDRFRRGAPPGPALPGAAVPADPREAARAELAPIFEAARRARAEADRIIEAAGDLAAARRQAAHGEAVEILRRAGEEAIEIRTGRAKVARDDIEGVIAETRRAAAARVAVIELEAQRAEPGLVAAVVADLRHLAREGGP